MDKDRQHPPDYPYAERSNAPGAEPDRDLGPEFYHEQAQAVEQRLRRYLDERLDGMAQQAGRPGMAASKAGWQRWRPEIYAGILLVLLVVLTWPPPFLAGGEGESAPQSTAENQENSSQPVTETPDESASGETMPPITVPSDPEAAWADFVEAHRPDLAAWSQAVVEARGLAADEVSDQQKTNFRRISEALSANQELTENRILLRRGLFEYIYGLWAKRLQGTPPPDFVVNQLFQGYDKEVLRSLAANLSLPETVSFQTPRENSLLQYLVVTQMVSNQEPPGGPPES